MQTRLSSLIEAIINVLIGFWIAFASNLIVLPHFGLHITLADNFAIGGIYTAISIARSYIIRRWFNARIHRMAQRLGARSPSCP